MKYIKFALYYLPVLLLMDAMALLTVKTDLYWRSYNIKLSMDKTNKQNRRIKG